MSQGKRRRPTDFQRAADGSMTLMEHIYELRNRVLKAVLAIIAGAVAMFVLAEPVQQFVLEPYCEYAITVNPTQTCGLNFPNPLDAFMLQLKIALYLGLVVSAPIWLYQLWAFVAPGLHRRERRYTYAFVAIAAPLFSVGSALGFIMVTKSMQFLLRSVPTMDGLTLSINAIEYFDFVTLVMLIFGLGFEFPLVALVLNVAGVVSARRLLSWWRVAVFLMFAFAGIVTPNPDPFSMIIFALCLSALYFAAVGIAFIVDARRARRRASDGVGDDEVSPIEPVSPVDAPSWGVHGEPDSSERR
jgi:sec-independent protein translocase protein TatC